MDEVVKQHKGDKYSTERYFCLVFLYLQIPHTLLIEKRVLCVLDKLQHLIADGNWKPTFSFERESGIGGCENLCKILWTMHIPRAQVHQSKNKNIFKEFTMNCKYGPFVQTLLKKLWDLNIRFWNSTWDLLEALVAKLARQKELNSGTECLPPSSILLFLFSAVQVKLHRQRE